MVINLSNEVSVVSELLKDLRDVNIQKNAYLFRHNLESLGMIAAYELSKNLEFKTETIFTPLEQTECNIIAKQIVLGLVLRAGLPYYNGFQRVFHNAETAFIGAMRGTHNADYTFDIDLHYLASPNLDQKTLILIDPMLATGKSLVKAYDALKKSGTPDNIWFASVIATQSGIDYLQKHISPAVNIITCAIDRELNHKFYIVPGLGDAGDLSFGPKI